MGQIFRRPWSKLLNRYSRNIQSPMTSSQEPTQPHYPDSPTPERSPYPPGAPVYPPPPPPPGPRPHVTPHSTQLRLGADGRYYRVRRKRRPLFPRLRSGCLSLILLLTCVCIASAAFLIVPGRTNILLIGIDYADPWTSVARTDTIMLASFAPLSRSINLLSIPRDLWVDIPQVGENRINTAHFYAESRQPGSGPQAVLDTIDQNFDLSIKYYLRVRFEGFRDIVDAMGGVDIELSEPMAGYAPGHHHLNGRKALAFVRDRANADDFFRMSHGQFMLRSLFKNLLNPVKWPRLPFIAKAVYDSVDTNIPFTVWPRLVLTAMLSGPGRINFHMITREMVTPYVTDQGANVLLPKWDLIHLLIQEIF